MIEHDPWCVFRSFDRDVKATTSVNVDQIKWGVHREKSPQAGSGIGEENGVVESDSL